MDNSEVIIVGGGLAGLCCALHLKKAGRSFKILEADQTAGGRVKTENYQGFRLDHGFQVLLTEYPEAQQVLDYAELDLKKFEPGALIQLQGQMKRLSDPWRRPQHLLATAFSPAATLMDKLRIAKLRRHVVGKKLEDIETQEDMTTLEFLQQWGFSSRVIERFFRPFLGGVYLESQLTTTSRKFEFVFKMFSQGDAAIPARGMGAIAEQLVEKVGPENISLGTRVARIHNNQVELENGKVLPTHQVVIACDQTGTEKLLGEDQGKSNGVKCLYFAAEQSPVDESILVLNGDGNGPVNNLCVPSQLSPQLAPDGQALVSVTVLPSDKVESESDLEQAVCQQLGNWFGEEVKRWEYLKTFHIPHALPQQNSPTTSRPEFFKLQEDGTIICGDHLANASIQGAMVSGRKAAEHILAKS